MAKDELTTIRSIMKDVRVAMLTSTSADGTLTSRPMATQEAEFDGDAWFLLSRGSDLAGEIATQPEVNVAYSSSDSWLSLSGRAELVVDDRQKAMLWNNAAEAWFPGGEQDPDVVLLKVSAVSAQFWDAPGKLPALLDMVKARLTGEQAGDVGTSKSTDL